MKAWFFVDGRLMAINAKTWDDILERTRELRSDGAVVRQAKAPKRVNPAMVRAAQHRTGGR